MHLPPELTHPPSQLDDAELEAIGVSRFAVALPDALALLRNDQLLRKALGDAMIDTYVAVRAHEHEAYGALPISDRIELLRFRY